MTAINQQFQNKVFNLDLDQQEMRANTMPPEGLEEMLWMKKEFYML